MAQAVRQGEAAEARLKANEALFSTNRWELYRKHMCTKSDIELQCTQQQAEDYLHREFDAKVYPSEPVPAYMPRVEEELVHTRITESEITAAMAKKTAASAPGADGVTRDILRAVLDCNELKTKLCWAFNEVLEGKCPPPSEWCSVRVRMIPKGQSDPTNIDEFRPIAVGSLTCKLLHSVLANRIWKHCLDNAVIDLNIQKGFAPKVSGCVEHITTLLQAYRSVKTPEQKYKCPELHVLLVDLRAAYNSVSHEKLWQVLEHIGISDTVIQYLKTIYGSTTMAIATKEWRTFPVPVGQGVMQGDTLSPLLFNIFFQVALQAALRKQSICETKLGKYNRHYLKAYADDLTVVCPSPGAIQIAWEALIDGFRWTGMTPNANKCRIIQMRFGKLVPRTEPFQIDYSEGGTLIPCGLANGGTKFLGLNVSISQEQSSTKTKQLLMSTLVDGMAKIGNMEIPLLAKFFFYETKVLNALRWYFTIYPNIPYSVAKALQHQAAQTMKQWAGLPTMASHAAITSYKALGVEDVRRVYRSTRGLTLNLCLNSDDIQVKKAAKDAAMLDTRFNHEDRKFLRELVANHERGETTNVRNEVRQTMREEKKKEVGNRAKWLEDCIEYSMPGAEHETDTFLKAVAQVLPYKAHYQFCRIIGGWWPVRALLAQAKIIQNNICPLCRAESQTICHVLNRCQVSLTQGRFTRRHDKVLKLIASAILAADKDHHQLRVWVDLDDMRDDTMLHEAWRTHLPNARPDIMITHQNGDLTIIELTCPFEAKGPITSHDRKVAKYTKNVESIRKEWNTNPKSAYRGRTVTLHCVEVGSRGYVSNTATVLQRYVGMDGKQFRQFLVNLGRTSFLESLWILKHRDTRKVF
ncbi:MAG: hypothetical protein JSU04_20505 [Bdellovibrionales bacterium]|nr:hypothetical protein [Bdellovibrionales bacterium]